MRIAFESAGGVCVLTSELDRHARDTYKAQRWKSQARDHVYIDDVEKIARMNPGKVPDFDVMVAGFPCQPYSIAGLREGLADAKGRGKVFLSMLSILAKKQPKAFLLENVKGMLSHDGGQTIRYMRHRLEQKGYRLTNSQVLNSMNHGGVPQNRERVFIVGYRDDLDVDTSEFRWPNPIQLKSSLRDVLEKSGVDEKYFYSAEKYDCFPEIEAAVKRTDTAYQWRRVYVRENKSGVCPALTANMGSGGHNVPLVRIGGRIRKLTPRECARLQGFSENFILPPGMADSHLYHQFGNSVTVPLIRRIAREVVKFV
jgi:DNA (cytosine-5)-methyltransferase 1